MIALRGKARNTVLLSAVSIIVLSLNLSTHSLGQSISHSDGGTYDYQDMSLVSKGNGNNSAINVTGLGTTVNGSNIEIIGADGVSSNTGARISGGASLSLTDFTVSNVQSGFTVSSTLDGPSSTLTLVGGSINATQPAIVSNDHGASIISVTDTVINTQSFNAAVDLGLNTTFTMRGGSIANNGGEGNGLFSFGKVILDGTHVSSQIGSAIVIQGYNGDLTANNFTAITTNRDRNGVNVNSGAKAVLTNGTINTSGQDSHGVWVTSLTNSQLPMQSAILEVDNLDITTTGLSADGISINNLSQASIYNSRITTERGHGIMVSSYESPNSTTPQQASAIVDNTTITLTGDAQNGIYGLYADDQNVQLDATNSHVNANRDYAHGVSAQNGATLTYSNGTINMTGANSNGAVLYNGSTMSFENSTIHGSGANSKGLVFAGGTRIGTMSFTDSSVSIDNGTAINNEGGVNNLTARNATISGDRLLYAGTYQNTYGSVFTLEAFNTALSGGADLDVNSTTNLNLSEGSSWTLTPLTNDSILPKPDDPTASAISTLGLHDSSLAFAAPIGGDGTTGYQTLTIGAGNVTTQDVYNATGTSSLTLNTFLNEGGALSNQYTDRVLINGNVSGTTMVNVIGHANSTGGLTSVGGNNLASEGISIIQVSGTAAEDSFQLAGEYTTVAGLPYQYRLYAYGPDATLGEADEEQRLVTGTDPYWDYRLQNVYYELPPEPPVDPTDPTDPTSPVGPGGDGGNNGGGWVPKVPVVAPQVTNYIIAPVALFQAGISDMGTLHQRLGEIRNQNGLNNGGNSLANKGEVFMRAYGGAYSYDSDRSLYQYGYNADIDYAAMQAGANLFALESPDSITRFGLTASYGQLSFEPKDVAFSEKTDLDVWSIAGHASYMHDSGFYLDGILAYGGFSGEVSNRLRGRTADLDGTRFMASLEAGYPIALNNGLVLEPQVQLIYQHLDFDRQMDVDQFAVAMGSQDLVTARIGGRVTKTFDNQADGRIVEVYAKANYLPTFSSGDDIFLGDNFTLGEYGDAVEGGIGVSASFDNDMSCISFLVNFTTISKFSR